MRCVPYSMNETQGIRVTDCRWSRWGSEIDGERTRGKHSPRDLCLVQPSKKRNAHNHLFLVNERPQSVQALLAHDKRILSTETLSISQPIAREETVDCPERVSSSSTRRCSFTLNIPQHPRIRFISVNPSNRLHAMSRFTRPNCNASRYRDSRVATSEKKRGPYQYIYVICTSEGR